MTLFKNTEIEQDTADRVLFRQNFESADAEIACFFNREQLAEFHYTLNYKRLQERIAAYNKLVKAIVDDLTTVYGRPTYTGNNWENLDGADFFTELNWDCVDVDGQAYLIILMIYVEQGLAVMDLIIALC